MSANTLTYQLIQQVSQLSPDQQRKVLIFIQSLERPEGTPGNDVLHFAGTISSEDLAVMKHVADEECEQVNPDDW